MAKILFCKNKNFNSEFTNLLKKRDDDDREIERKVDSIIENVKKKIRSSFNRSYKKIL